MASNINEIIFYQQPAMVNYYKKEYEFKKPILNHDIKIKINIEKRPVIGVYSAEDFKGQKGRQMIELIMRYAVKDVKLRSELKSLIYSIIDDDELLNFFMTMTPPRDKGYIFWDCPQMSKVKTLFTSDDETGFTFAFKCRALKMFFANTSQFYEVFSQQ